jgi:hypothetical protein
MSQQFALSEKKHSWEKFFVDLDISSWLGTETISQVNFTAKDSAGTDVTATFLDAVKCTYSGSVLKPYIQAGSDGARYYVIMKVTTNQQSYGVFILLVQVKDVP